MPQMVWTASLDGSIDYYNARWRSFAAFGESRNGDISQWADKLLQNLIGNAIKYRRDDEAPKVHVTVSSPEDHWHFIVSDNGIGIAPEFHATVFGVFKRLHSTSAKYAGTGMGLAICQKIVETCRGKIWVESTPGEGSQFHFTLPW